MANKYNLAFKDIQYIQIPKVILNSEHIYHQYTIRVLNGKRDDLKDYLNNMGVPTMIYYPIPIHKQKAYSNNQTLDNTEQLANEVISFPIHTEIENSNQDYIIQMVKNFFDV